MTPYPRGARILVDLHQLHHPAGVRTERTRASGQPPRWLTAEVTAVGPAAAGTPEHGHQTVYRVRIVGGALDGVSALATEAALQNAA